MKKEKMKTGSLVAMIITIAILTAGLVLSIIFWPQLFGESTWFNPLIDSGNVDSGGNPIMVVGPVSGNGVLDAIIHKIPAVIATIDYIFVGYLLIKLIKFLSELLFKKASNKAKTVMTLTRSLLKWAIIICVVFFSLSAFGVDTTTLLAGLGIIALIIGLGAQSIISDILAGFFIVFEDEFKVGDIIVIDGWRGTVTEIGIRMTKLIDAGGNVKIINNHDIREVVNQTDELSIAFIRMNIDYAEDLKRVELVIKNNIERIQNNVQNIQEGPFYKGVSGLLDSSVELLFVVKCFEEDFYQVQRDVTRELFLIFNENDIVIPFNQVVVTPRKDAEPVTVDRTAREEKQVQKEADEFLSEQSEQTKDISIDNSNR